MKGESLDVRAGLKVRPPDRADLATHGGLILLRCLIWLIGLICGAGRACGREEDGRDEDAMRDLGVTGSRGGYLGYRGRYVECRRTSRWARRVERAEWLTR